MRERTRRKDVESFQGAMLTEVLDAPRSKDGSRTIASVGRVGAVLDLFGGAQVDRGIGESAALLGISKSATHALFATLVEIGLLERTPEARYRLGWRLLVLSRQLVRSIEYRDPVVHGMHAFASRWGDTMHLAVLDRGRVVYIQRVEGIHAAGVPTQVGTRMYAHGSAVGKALLAHLRPEVLRDVILREGLPALTAATITDEKTLTAELEKVSLQGYATDHEETLSGVSCVAAPIKGPSGHVVAAMSVCARKERFERNWPSYVRAVRSTARAASERLAEERRWPAGVEGDA